MTPMPGSPFISDPVESFPASTRSAGAACVQPPSMAPAEPIPNSAGVVMPLADTAVIDPERHSVAAVPINVIGHNAITHAVEVRPQVSPSAAAEPLIDRPKASRDWEVSRPNRELDSPDWGQNHIGEIFVGARRLPQRELPPDFHARLLEAIESDVVFADPPPLFLQRARDV